MVESALRQKLTDAIHELENDNVFICVIQNVWFNSKSDKIGIKWLTNKIIDKYNYLVSYDHTHHEIIIYKHSDYEDDYVWGMPTVFTDKHCVFL